MTESLKERRERIKRELLASRGGKCEIYCQNYHAELHDRKEWVYENGKRTPK